MKVREIGEFIREQRRNSSLTIRKLSDLSGISVPYLSQVERGLRKPSADILQALAKGLRISAETMYVRAGILEERPASDTRSCILKDQSITERQRQTLVEIFDSFQAETARKRRSRKSKPRSSKAS